MPDFISRLKGSQEGLLLVAILILAVVWTGLTPHFLKLANFVDLIESYSVTAVLAMGLFVVLVSGGIDISFMATASIAQYVAAYAAARMGLPTPVAIVTGLGVGLILGLVNAVLIYRLRIISIIVTIATMNTYFALLMYFTGGKSIYDLPDWWSNRITFWRTETTDGDIVRLTLPIVVMVVAILLTWLLMNVSSAGRQVYAMGGNREGARRIGISIGGVHLLAYGYMGLMAGAAGLLQAHRVGESVPNAMFGGELNVLAAAVLGGASLKGGIGTVGGVMLGILMLAILQNGLNLLGVSPYFFQIVIGLVILVSTSITGLSSRPKRRAAKATKEATP